MDLGENYGSSHHASIVRGTKNSNFCSEHVFKPGNEHFTVLMLSFLSKLKRKIVCHIEYCEALSHFAG